MVVAPLKASHNVLYGIAFCRKEMLHCLHGKSARSSATPRPDPGPGRRRRRGRDPALLEFFTANIRNRNTRAAYARAVAGFFRWCEGGGFASSTASSPCMSPPTSSSSGRRTRRPRVKQHLAAVRMLFDWLVVGQVVRSNPASVVRGPSHVVKRGRTPILSPEEAHQLFESIPTDSLVGLRDRALIGVLIYSFARISAALAMRVEDYFPQGKRWWLRLHEKGGKNHEMPVHHTLEAYLDAYVRAAGIGEDKKGPLFRAALAKNGRSLGASLGCAAMPWR